MEFARQCHQHDFQSTYTCIHEIVKKLDFFTTIPDMIERKSKRGEKEKIRKEHVSN